MALTANGRSDRCAFVVFTKVAGVPGQLELAETAIEISLPRLTRLHDDEDYKGRRGAVGLIDAWGIFGKPHEAPPGFIVRQCLY